jgi:hypothetical protein
MQNDHLVSAARDSRIVSSVEGILLHNLKKP